MNFSRDPEDRDKPAPPGGAADGLRKLLETLTSAFVVGMGSRLVIQLFALAQIMMASRHFGLADFGAYALAWACAMIFASFMYTGYYQALLRSKTPDQDRNTVFTVMLAIGTLAGLVLLATGTLIVEYQSLTSQICLAFAVLPLLDAVVAWNDVHLLRAARVRTSSLINAAAEAMATLVLLIALRQGMGAMSLVLGRYTAVSLQLILTSTAVRRLPGLALRPDVLRQGWPTAVPLWASTGAGMLTNYGIDLILGAFLNPSQVGAYRGGARISQTAADLIQQPLTMLTWSRFSRLDKTGRRHRIRHFWRVNMSFAAAAAWPVMLCVALMAEEIVTVVLDESWLPAAAVIGILSLMRAIRILSMHLEPTLVNFDRQYLLLKIRLFGLALLMAAMFLYGRFGAVEAAYAQLFTVAVMAGISLATAGRILSIRSGDMLRTFLPGLAVSAACGVFVVLTGSWRAAADPAAGLFLTLSGVALIWCLAVWLAVLKRMLSWPTP
jgi:O-antigen/teichoic acid export membrane protein